MISVEAKKGRYLPTIGIECHVQLSTLSKLFSSESNDARRAKPNSTISPISFGYPGVLPVLNKEAVRLAIRAGLVLNARINLRSLFDRKHYFYPDLPKGYQISQFHQPIIGAGFVDIPIKGGQNRRIGITRAHLEEDAGKLIHPTGSNYSYVDLNRAGTPLIEIVSEPHLHSADEAKSFAQELYYLMKYAAVSDVDLYHGNMRFDVNISIAEKGKKVLGIRSEVKNLNSFKSVQRCVEYEIDRQIRLKESGEENVQQTRGWDEVHQKTVAQRGKEESHDYRYFPDPDLPPVIIDDAEIEAEKSTLPVLPAQRRKILANIGIDFSQINAFINDRPLGDLMLAVADKATKAQARRIANWLSVDLASMLGGTDQATSLLKLNVARLVELAGYTDSGRLNNLQTKRVLEELLKGDVAISKLIQRAGWKELDNASDLQALIDQTIAACPTAVEDYRRGKKAALHFLLGKVMQASSGSANPQTAEKALRKTIGL